MEPLAFAGMSCLAKHATTNKVGRDDGATYEVHVNTCFTLPTLRMVAQLTEAPGHGVPGKSVTWVDLRECAIVVEGTVGKLVATRATVQACKKEG